VAFKVVVGEHAHVAVCPHLLRAITGEVVPVGRDLAFDRAEFLRHAVTRVVLHARELAARIAAARDILRVVVGERAPMILGVNCRCQAVRVVVFARAHLIGKTRT